MYTHVYGLFTIIAQNLYVVIRKLALQKQDDGPSWFQWLGYQVLFLVAFAPWVHILLHHCCEATSSGCLAANAIA